MISYIANDIDHVLVKDNDIKRVCGSYCHSLFNDVRLVVMDRNIDKYLGSHQTCNQGHT